LFKSFNFICLKKVLTVTEDFTGLEFFDHQLRCRGGGL